MSTQNKIEFRGSFSQIMAAIRTGPELMRLSIDIPLSERKNAMGLHALIDQPLRFTVEVDHAPASTRIERPSENGKAKAKKEPKEPAGPFWAYWKYMFAHSFFNFPSLVQTLDCAGETQIKLRLYDIFKVDTCADISPTEFEKWMESEGSDKFASLINVSRLAQAAVPEIESRKARKQQAEKQ